MNLFIYGYTVTSQITRYNIKPQCLVSINYSCKYAKKVFLKKIGKILIDFDVSPPEIDNTCILFFC